MPAHDQASLVCTGNGLLSTGELTEELMKVDGLRGEKDRFFFKGMGLIRPTTCQWMTPFP